MYLNSLSTYNCYEEFANCLSPDDLRISHLHYFDASVFSIERVCYFIQSKKFTRPHRRPLA